MTLTFPSNQTNRRGPDMSGLHRLWVSEFGNRQEVVVRILVMIAAGFGVWVHSGWLMAPIWVLAYLAGTALTYIALRPRNPDHPATRALGIGSFFLSTAVFVSLPLYAIAMGDPVLQFCGAMGIVTLCVFNLFREETPAILLPFDVAIGWTAIGIIAATFIPGQSSFVAEAIMVLLCLVAGGYYTLALIETRATQARLREAARRKQAEREMEAIGRLSGGIAHDFNNILTVLQGCLELYHVVPQGKERDILVDEAQDASKRASALVSQLLAFAQRAPLDPIALDVGDCMAGLAALSRELLPVGVALETRVPPDPVAVMADADGLRTAILNLVRNARDAVGSRGAVILAVDMCKGPADKATCIPESNPGDAHLRFSVADDGPGMTSEASRRALEPFFSTRPVGKGSGLGLSMAKGFAEQSGGALRLQTSENGTIVSLHLPIALPRA